MHKMKDELKSVIKRKAVGITVLILDFVLFVTSFGISSAWFSQVNNEADPHINQGSVIRQYFHCGTGTDTDPFVITRPIHYYHLVELYQRTSGFADKDYHFQLGYDLNNDGKLEVYKYDNYGNTDLTFSDTLNMAYYSGKFALLPVGTSDVPFNGTFDGSGLTINNLNICAKETVNGVDYATCDVGVFGYLGEDAVVKDIYYNNLIIDISDINLTSINEEDHNDLVHNTKDSVQGYVGYIAGHARFSSTISNVYINNSKIKGKGLAQNYFGYVGVIENNSGQILATIGEAVQELRTKGNDVGWGSTLDMAELYNRLYQIARSVRNTGDPIYTSKEIVVKNESGQILSSYVTETSDDILSHSGYSLDLVAYQSELGGSYSFNIANGYNPWIYLTGYTEYQQKTVITYTLTEDKSKTAYYISDKSGQNFLSLGSNVTTVANKKSSEATKWTLDSSNHLFTYVGITPYYLVREGTTLSVSTTASTAWTIEDDSFGGTKFHDGDYYLLYDGVWQITTLVPTISITDGNNHYISITNNKITNTEVVGTATEWVNTSYNSGSQESFKTTVGTSTKYLAYVAGTGLGLSNSEFKWTVSKDGSGNKSYSYNDGTYTWYLAYNDGWNAVVLSGYSISITSGGATHYLGISRFLDSTIDQTSISYLSLWQANVSASSTTICCKYNGQTYYLGADVSTGKLTISTTASTWIKDVNGKYYVKVNNKPYYLTYSNGWKVETSDKFNITRGSNYLSVSTSDFSITNATSSSSATAWDWAVSGGESSGYIYTTIDDTIYYLTADNSRNLYVTTARDDVMEGSTVVTKGAVTWKKDINGFYIEINSIEYYLSYDADSGWFLNEVFYEFRWGDHYLHYKKENGVWVSNHTKDGSLYNIRWKYNGQSIWMVQGGKKYYLTFVGENQAPSLSTTPYYWDITDTHVYTLDGNYCLTFLGGVWATPRTATTYFITNGTYKLTPTDDQSEILNDVTGYSARYAHWIMDFSTGKISQMCNGKEYFLNADDATLSTSTTQSTYWYLDNDVIPGSIYYYVTPLTRRYIVFSEKDGWRTMELYYYQISDNGNYLGLAVNVSKETASVNNQSGYNGGSSGCTEWQVTPIDGKYAIGQSWKKVAYYLTSNNSGAVSITKTPSYWYKDDYGFYQYSGMYLGYDTNNGWCTDVLNAYLISDYMGNYLKISGSTFSNSTSQSSGSKFFIEGSLTSPPFACYIKENGTKKYLNASGSTLSMGTSSTTSWTLSNGALYYNGYWLVYDSTWKLVNSSKYYILATCNNQYYFVTENISSGSSNTNRNILGTTDRTQAIAFTFSNVSNNTAPAGQASYTSGSSTRYLCIYDGWTDYLQTSTSNYGSFTNTGTQLYRSGVGYITYDPSNNQFTCSSKESAYKIEQIVYGGAQFYTYVHGSAKQGSITYTSQKSYLAHREAWGPGNTTHNANGTSNFGQETAAVGDIAGFSFTSKTISPNPTASTVVREKESTIIKNQTYGDTLSDPVTLTKQRSGIATYIPIRLALQNENDSTSYYSDYRAHEKNTGYIVSGSYQTSSSYRSDIRVSNYDTSDIRRAFNTTGTPTFSSTYDARMQVVTRTATSNGYVRIDDSHNHANINSYSSYLPSTSMTVEALGLQKYSSTTEDLAREDFANTLMGGNDVYGLHFMEATINKNHTIVADQVSILNKTYYNYELPESSIDFNVFERGSVNFFAGTYYSDDVDAFFSLHQVFRDSNKHITDIKEITKVYQHSTKKDGKAYIYQYNNTSDYSTSETVSTNSDGSIKVNGVQYDLVFDLSWITNPSSIIQNALYYFEVPLNKGEYALGSVENNIGAYLLYLDIAIKGGMNSSQTAIAESSEVSALTFDVRSAPDTTDYGLIEFAFNCPAEATSDTFWVNVFFTDEGVNGTAYKNGLYTIEVHNTTGVDIDIDVLLIDDDNDPNNEYYYAYQVIYTNKKYTTSKILQRDLDDTKYDYWQASASFTISSTADAEEKEY